MAFCIECGTKSPDLAKFCPKCGTAIAKIPNQDAQKQDAPSIDENIEGPVEHAPQTITDAVANNAPLEEGQKDDVQEKDAVSDASMETKTGVVSASPDVTEIEIKPAVEIEPAKPAPSLQDSLAASVNADVPAAKSKAGLWAGLSLIALLAAGGGAYALGLFPSGAADTQTAAAPGPEEAAPQTVETEPAAAPAKPAALAAYQAAIKTGRISDLGKFAQKYPENSLAKDAQVAAYASLQRQGTPLAYNTFTQYFPEADLSTYTGARNNSDLPPEKTDATTDAATDKTAGETAEFTPTETAPTVNLAIPTIRPSITARVDALEPFIAQGDGAYALSVADELLSIADLNEDEATYLLNVRARAETAGGFKTAAPATLAGIEPSLETQPDVDMTQDAGKMTPAPEAIVPAAAFDTPAKPIDRFGAITPDEATEPGECDMTFSVDISGTPTNIVASCTQLLFAAPATETVGEWSYSPATLNGAPVQQDGLVVKIKFHLEEPE